MVIIVSRFFKCSAVLLEGGITATSILFEKYKVTDIIYESDTVTVYVVEHLFMSAKRIIKKILKKSICRDNFYSEVNILKSIRHSHIPIIYDVEEDSFAYFIIEEYIEGINLDTYIEEHGVMSEQEATDIGIKICDIVSFLHCQKPIPILFLDVHPKNILINNAKIFLVDFGSSYYFNETEKRKLLMGTVGYAAPEQYKHGALDEQTDVYGIGAVLYFLVTGRSCGQEDVLSLNFPQEISEKYKMIVMQCLAHDRKDRFQSVEMVAKTLSKLYKNDNICTSSNEKPRIISFAGTDRRVGVTHICLAFASYLSKQGYSVLYEESNDSNHLRLIARNKKMKYHNGLFYEDKLMLKPLYGMQVSLDVDCDYVIRDCGEYNSEICEDSSVAVIVAGAKHWELEKSIDICRNAVDTMISFGKAEQIHVLCNGSSGNNMLLLWRKIGCIGKQVPVLQDIFQYNDIDKQFFEEVADVIGINKKGGAMNKKKKWSFRKITR